MSLQELRTRYREFVYERNWDQFHTPQNLAMAISVESSELIERFMWMDNPSSEAIQRDDELMENVRDEMADILIYLLGLANQLDIDLIDAVEQKMDQNEERFDEDTVEDINDYLDEWQSN